MGAVFGLGMLALMILFVCLTVAGAVFLLLALIFGLVCLGKVRRSRKSGGKVRTVWKVLPCAFLIAGLLMVYPGISVWRMLNDPNEQLSDAVLHDDYEKAEELLDSGTDPDDNAKAGEYTLLCRIADQGLLQVNIGDGVQTWTRKGTHPEKELQYERLLLEHGADVNHRVKEQLKDRERPHSSTEAKDPSQRTGALHACGKTPLLLAASRGDLSSVELFVEYGADINAVDDCGYNAVLIVCQLCKDEEGGAELLQYLLDQGCDGGAVTDFGQNALDLVDEVPDDGQDAMRALLQ